MDGERRVTLELTMNQLWIVDEALNRYRKDKWDEYCSVGNVFHAVYRGMEYPEAYYDYRNVLESEQERASEVLSLVTKKIIEEEKKDEDNNAD